MKFTPRRIGEEVNYSKEHPLREFAVLAGGLLGTLVLVYVLLGFAVDLVVPRIGPELELRLGGMLPRPESGDEGGAETAVRLQAILDDLAREMKDDGRTYRVTIVDDETANALALPGGTIVVFSGLVEEARSENELAMVLGHELGHFSHRDHLRGLGRGLVLVVLSSLFTGTDSTISRFVGSTLGGAEMRFSQKQELRADRFGLDLLMGRYGHAGGATDFFSRILEKKGESRLAYLFASHPYPEKRVAVLEATIAARGYPVKESIPFRPAP